MAWFAFHPQGKTKEFCQDCRLTQKGVMDEGGMPYEWMGQHLHAGERIEAAKWAKSVPKVELLEARFQNYPLGEWVVSSVVSTFRADPIQLDDPKVERVFRSYLFGAAVTAIIWNRLLDEWKPDATIIFNARQAFSRVAFNLTRARDIRVLVHERPITAGSIFVVDNDTCLSPRPFQQFWKSWKDVALTRPQLEQVARWLQERRYGGAQVYISFANAPAAIDVRAHFGLIASRKLLVLFTSSTDEFAGDPELQGPFDSQEAWIEQVVACVGARDDYDLIVRVHPSLSGKGEMGRASDQTRWFEQLAQRLPTNVRLVPADDALSSYDLIDQADAGLTFGSTVGLEMLSLGKPIASVAPLPIYQNVEGVFLMNGPQHVEDVLSTLIGTAPSREFQRAAFRCSHQFFFHMQMPFLLVDWYNRHESAVTYTSPDALRAGADPTLDLICDFLLKGTALYSAPGACETSRSIVEEDEFFAEIGVDESWLRMSKAEYRALQKQNQKAPPETLRQKALRVLPTPLIKFIGRLLAVCR